MQTDQDRMWEAYQKLTMARGLVTKAAKTYRDVRTSDAFQMLTTMLQAEESAAAEFREMQLAGALGSMPNVLIS